MAVNKDIFYRDFTLLNFNLITFNLIILIRAKGTEIRGKQAWLLSH